MSARRGELRLEEHAGKDRVARVRESGTLNERSGIRIDLSRYMMDFSYPSWPEVPASVDGVFLRGDAQFMATSLLELVEMYKGSPPDTRLVWGRRMRAILEAQYESCMSVLRGRAMSVALVQSVPEAGLLRELQDIQAEALLRAAWTSIRQGKELELEIAIPDPENISTFRQMDEWLDQVSRQTLLGYRGSVPYRVGAIYSGIEYTRIHVDMARIAEFVILDGTPKTTADTCSGYNHAASSGEWTGLANALSGIKPHIKVWATAKGQQPCAIERYLQDVTLGEAYGFICEPDVFTQV
ncbi:hypothetical protein D3C74_18220 [compost metagenome]